MQKYKIIIMPMAEDDIVGLADYILYIKKAPEAAGRLVSGIRRQIVGLEFLPQRHPLDEDRELAILHIRKQYFKNYKIYYLINEKECTVYILRVLHMLTDSKSQILHIFQD